MKLTAAKILATFLDEEIISLANEVIGYDLRLSIGEAINVIRLTF